MNSFSLRKGINFFAILKKLQHRGKETEGLKATNVIET